MEDRNHLKELYQSVVIQAMKDINAFITAPSDIETKKKESETYQDYKSGKDSRRWFSLRNEDFIWSCDFAEVCPVRVHRAVTTALKNMEPVTVDIDTYYRKFKKRAT